MGREWGRKVSDSLAAPFHFFLTRSWHLVHPDRKGVSIDHRATNANGAHAMQISTGDDSHGEHHHRVFAGSVECRH